MLRFRSLCETREHESIALRRKLQVANSRLQWGGLVPLVGKLFLVLSLKKSRRAKWKASMEIFATVPLIIMLFLANYEGIMRADAAPFIELRSRSVAITAVRRAQ